MEPTTDDITSLTLQVCESVHGLPIESDGPSVERSEIPVSGTVWITGGWDGAVAIRGNDAIGEIANMIGGNIKSLLPGPSKLSLPSVDHEGEAPDVAAAPGHSTTWNFLVNGEPFAVTIVIGAGTNKEAVNS
jgi:chemotaxis protein CheX